MNHSRYHTAFFSALILIISSCTSLSAPADSTPSDNIPNSNGIINSNTSASNNGQVVDVKTIGVSLSRDTLSAITLPKNVNLVFIEDMNPLKDNSFDNLTTPEINAIKKFHTSNIQVKAILGNSPISIADAILYENRANFIIQITDFLNNNELDGLHLRFNQGEMTSDFPDFVEELSIALTHSKKSLSLQLTPEIYRSLNTSVLSNLAGFEIVNKPIPYDSTTLYSNLNNLYTSASYFTEVLKILPGKIMLPIPTHGTLVYSDSNWQSISLKQIYSKNPKILTENRFLNSSGEGTIHAYSRKTTSELISHFQKLGIETYILESLNDDLLDNNSYLSLMK